MFRSRLEETPFDVLWKRYHARAVEYAMKMMGNADDAEDAVQDAFLRVVEYRHSFDPTAGSFSAWFFGILRNCCRDGLRRRSCPETVVDPDVVQGWAVVKDDGDDVLTVAVMEAFAGLPRNLKTLLRMRFWENKSYEEIGKEQGCSVEAAKKRVYRAVVLLRQIVDGKVSRGGKE